MSSHADFATSASAIPKSQFTKKYSFIPTVDSPSNTAKVIVVLTMSPINFSVPASSLASCNSSVAPSFQNSPTWPMPSSCSQNFSQSFLSSNVISDSSSHMKLGLIVVIKQCPSVVNGSGIVSNPSPLPSDQKVKPVHVIP
jgi:hypothetical protein